MLLKIRIGGIFLDNHTKQTSPLPARYSLFHPLPKIDGKLQLSKSCNKANSRFHNIHAHYAKKSLKENYIVIFLRGELSLWKKDEKNNYTEIESQPTAATATTYNYLKTLLHLSTTIFMLADLYKQGHMTNAEAQDHLHGINLDLEEMTQWEIEIECDSLILGKNLKALLQLELKKEQSLQQLVTMLGAQQPLLLKQISEHVTFLQLKNMNDIIKCWEGTYALCKDDARAIVVGTQGPRKGMIEVQYLEHYFMNQSELVFYVEMPGALMSLATGSMVIEYLSKEASNNRIGEMIFNNKKAMQEDILSLYAPPVIEQLKKMEQPQITHCPYMT